MFCKDRRKSAYLAASYISWFVAIGTYTIQIGAIAAIFFVSLRQRIINASWLKGFSWRGNGRASRMLRFLMLYLMLWITASFTWSYRLGLHYQFSFDALTTSINAEFGTATIMFSGYG